MLRKNTSHGIAWKALFLLAVAAGSLQALEEPDRSGLGQAEFRSVELTIENEYLEPRELPAQAMANAEADLAALGVRSDSGFVDRRGGRWATLLLSEPLVPGKGNGNGLSWAGLGRKAPKNTAEHANAASQAFRGYLENNSHPLRIDLDELADPGKVSVHQDGAVIQIYMPRVFEGVPVRGSHLTATINHGNLVLFGTDNWGDIKSSTAPGITKKAADDAVQAHVGSYAVSGEWGKSELVLIPVAVGRNPKQVAVGEGFDYRLAWVIRPAFDGDQRRFEALVDAQTGQLLSFEDTNHYAEVKGGVLPVTNDGISPDGVEQSGWPMPYADVGSETTDTGGNFSSSGTVTTDFYGPYVNINDNCGSSSLTGSGVLDWGTSGGTDCTTPGFGGAGNTHASRTGFYELNKIIEMARGQLPSNSWLQSRLTSNMNINNTCNAFWNGTVNFYRSGGGCFNTGEIAGVFDHEWGHGMDANDATPGIASPSGEGVADIYTALRLNDSCIGRNFRATNCSGFGDPCLSCTGVRDIDYLKRASGNPHDYSWSNANCGGSVHCVGAVYSEAVWSLWKRELQDPPYNYDNNTAHEIVNRLTFIGAGNTGTWFSGGPPNGGCASTSGYMNYLAADDDNGNLNDGTPHMTAIYNAFNDQEIACQTPTVQDSGCANTPTTAPNVNANVFDKSVGLSWNSVTGATEYEVFRTEGVFACDFGKVKLGSTTGTSWNDTGLQNGRDYSYIVIPKGSADACFGPASACETAAPVAGPGLTIDIASASNLVSGAGGDGDSYLDNCEEGSTTFDITNTGLGGLTNVNIVSVTPSNGGVSITGSSVTPSSLGQGATAVGSFSYAAEGLAAGEELTFTVEVIADEISGSYIVDLGAISTETDLTFVSSQTYSFESDDEGWTTMQGTFGRSSSGGGSDGSWYEQSSANLDNQCDQIVSPTFVFSATTTLSLWNNFDIEPYHNPSASWYDRANVGLVVDGGSRSLVTPDSGRPYNASGAEGTCGTTGQSGWADTADTWGESSWSATALGSAALDGAEVQLDIRYGTDASLNGYGFRFDELTLTDFYVQGADTQPDSCGAPANQPPVVTITAPEDGSTFVEGTSITFTATATDFEDGDLAADIEWFEADTPIGIGASITCPNDCNALAPGSHTIRAEVTDLGNSTGTPETGFAEVSVTVEAANPAITLVKTGTLDDGGDGVANAGDTIGYAFTVTNIGNVTLTNVVVTDPKVTGLSGSIASLAPGTSDDATFSGSYSLTQGDVDAGSFTNTAMAQSDQGASDDDSDTQALAAVPALTLVKTGTLNDGGDGVPNVGDTISYAFTVTNTGNVTLSNISISDPDATITGGSIISLAPNAVDNTTITGGHELTLTDIDAGSFTNTATVTGSSPGKTNDVTDTDSDTQSLTAPSVHVASVVTGTANADVGRGNKHGTATVTVVDNDGNPASGYAVSGAFGGSFTEPASGDTDGNGVVTLTTIGYDKGVTVTFCVSAVQGTLSYKPDDNGSGVTTCGVLPPDPQCGNAVIETGEDCEGNDLNGESCISLGYDGGTLACQVSTCTFDTSSCSLPSCGASNDSCSGDSDCCSGKCRTNGAKANTCT